MKLFNSYKSQSNEELMIAIQNGNHQAFSQLYDRFASRLKAFFYRMLWSDDLKSEDFVYDLFEKLIEKPESFDSGKKFEPWIFQVASNMCKNAYRKKQFEDEYLRHLDKSGISMTDPSKSIDETILTDKVHQLLLKMGEDKRDLFLLRYQQELSIKQLSQKLEINEGTVKSRLFAIREELTGELSKVE